MQDHIQHEKNLVATVQRESQTQLLCCQAVKRVGEAEVEGSMGRLFKNRPQSRKNTGALAEIWDINETNPIKASAKHEAC